MKKMNKEDIELMKNEITELKEIRNNLVDKLNKCKKLNIDILNNYKKSIIMFILFGLFTGIFIIILLYMIFQLN